MKTAVVLAAAVASLGAAGPIPFRLRSDDMAIVAAARQCFAAAEGKALRPSGRTAVPPGLIGGHQVAVDPLPSRHGRNYSYVGIAPGVVTCGVAVYASVSNRLVTAMVAAIEQDGRWQPRPSTFWPIDTSAADHRYWGDPHAPGLIGVTMLRRRPGDAAPSLEMQYHSVLMN